MADPLILALETATACASVALTRGGRAGGQLLAEGKIMPHFNFLKIFNLE